MLCFNLETGEQNNQADPLEETRWKTLWTETIGAESAQRDPDQMLMWIHGAAAYHTLLTSGAERSGSCNVPCWLYWITEAWPQRNGWLQTLTQLRLPTWLIYKSLSDLIHWQESKM